MPKTDEAINNVYFPPMSDKALADMYSETPIDKLISMIAENIAGSFKFNKDELKLILSKCLPTTLVDIMCPIHRFNETRKIEVTHVTGQNIRQDGNYNPEKPTLVKPPQKPNTIHIPEWVLPPRNLAGRIINYVPYQLCPKCQGQGSVAMPPNLPYSPAGNQWTSSSLSHQCDVCNGAKVIPMYPLIPGIEDKHETILKDKP